MRAADHEFGDILTHRMRQKVPCIRISSRESAGEGICRAVGGACPDLGRSAADACGVDVDTLIDVSDLVAPPTSVSTRRGQPRSAHSVGPSDGFQAKGLRRPDRAFWLTRSPDLRRWRPRGGQQSCDSRSHRPLDVCRPTPDERGQRTEDTDRRPGGSPAVDALRVCRAELAIRKPHHWAAAIYDSQKWETLSDGID